MDEANAETLLLTVLRNDMQAILDRYVSAQRQQVVAACENWWDKYRVTLADLEREREGATTTLRGFVQELGYAR